MAEEDINKRDFFRLTFEVKGELIAGELWRKMGYGSKDRHSLDLMEFEAVCARAYADGYRDGYLNGTAAAGKLWRACLDNMTGDT